MATDLIQVLTMGRVGSISTQRSIEKRIGKKVPHIHSINPAILARQVAKAGSVTKAARSVQEGLSAIAQLLRHQGTVKTVTLVRDSISRNISAAFADLRNKYSKLEQLDDFLSDPGKVRQAWHSFYDRRPYTWFDNEFREVLGIDVYTHPFAHTGATTIRSGRYEILIMRTELDDRSKSGALADFIGVDDVPIHHHNNESSTKYSRRYELFRRSIALEEEYVREVARSQYTRHFYESWSLENYVEHWMEQTRPNSSLES